MAAQARAQAIEVAAAVILQHGRLLITLRRPDVPQGGRWEFPGGKRLPREGLATCLRRELREELGVEIEVGPKLATVEHVYPDSAVRLHFYRCQLRAGVPKPLGCEAVRWVRPAELGRYRFPEADRAFIQALPRRLADDGSRNARPAAT